MRTFQPTRRQNRPRRSVIVKPSRLEADRAGVQEALGYPVRAKLKVGAPDDAHEREADALAHRLLGAPETPRHEDPTWPEADQREQKPAGESTPERKEPVRRAPAPVEEGERLRAPAQEEQALPEVLEGKIAALQTGGEPLPPPLRDDFEARFGLNLGRVRIHRDAHAARLNEVLHARAFTVGEHVAFNEGCFKPDTAPGRLLLAHELAHVAQQRGEAANLERRAGRRGFWSELCRSTASKLGGVATRTADTIGNFARNLWEGSRQRNGMGGQPQIAPNHGTHLLIQRKTVQEELNEELAAWAKKNKKSTDPEDRNFGFALQEYAWSLIADPDMANPIPKPEKRKEIKEWERKFEKAGLLAEMILGGGKKVEQKEIRAAMILNLMARAGFSAKPVELAKGMKDFEQIEHVYSGVLDRVEKADTDSLTTMTEAFIKKKGKKKNPIIDKLTDSSGSFEKKLTNAQLTAILKPLIDAYEKDAILIEILSEVLVHKSGYRKTFSDWMWKEKKGELLFRVLQSDYFLEPDYGPTAFPEVGELTLEKDMPWVYANKQKYYVDYLVQLGKDGGQNIKAPKNLKLKTLRKWLDENTEAIGRALAKKYPDKPEKWIEVYEQLTDVFMYHVDGKNVVPDPTGKLAKLKPGAPQKMRLKVDCDVLSTFAMRFFQGATDPTNPKLKPFEPVGYMSVDPTDAEGHSVALMRRDGTYYVISNKQVFKTTVVETKKDEKKQEAKRAMKSTALDVYSAAPADYKIYYADAPDGALPKALSTQEDSTRQTDLEP